jgi:hypothetical protein
VKVISWLLLIGVVAGLSFAFWRWRRRWEERNRTADERMTAFIAQAAPAAQPVPVAPAAPRSEPGLLQQKLLFEAASKAREAGEPALSIQLYERLLSRYPESALAGQARAAIEAQKKKLAQP